MENLLEGGELDYRSRAEKKKDKEIKGLDAQKDFVKKTMGLVLLQLAFTMSVTLAMKS